VRRSSMRIQAAGVLLVAVLAGCGSQGGDSAVTSTPEPPVPASAIPPTTAPPSSAPPTTTPPPPTPPTSRPTSAPPSSAPASSPPATSPPTTSAPSTSAPATSTPPQPTVLPDELQEPLPPPGGGKAAAGQSISGTVVEGVEAGCLLLSTPDGDYLLLGGDRSVVRAGATLTVRGRADRSVMTTCQQGVPFKVVSATAG